MRSVHQCSLPTSPQQAQHQAWDLGGNSDGTVQFNQVFRRLSGPGTAGLGCVEPTMGSPTRQFQPGLEPGSATPVRSEGRHRPQPIAAEGVLVRYQANVFCWTSASFPGYNWSDHSMATQSPSRARTDVTAKLVTAFKDLISRGVLKAGSKLPPERELARMFGVSRSSLRQALKFLDIMGVLVQRVGDGSYLGSGASVILNEPLEFLVGLEGIDLDELVEARLIVEPELAARAAERATTEDLQAIERALELMKACKSEPLKVVEHDYAFHRAVHHAARNRICESMFGVVHRAVMASISIASRQVDLSHTLGFHTGIYRAIRNRKPDDARRVMTEHLLDVRKLLSSARGRTNPDILQYEIRPIGTADLRKREPDLVP